MNELLAIGAVLIGALAAAGHYPNMKQGYLDELNLESK